MKKKVIVAGSILALALLSIYIYLGFRWRSRQVAEWEMPLSDVRVVFFSLITYYDTYDSFPLDLRSLGGYRKGVAPSANAAGLMSNKLASGSAVGYRFTYHPFSSKPKGPLDRFTLNADPIEGCSTVHVNYLSDEHGVFQKDCRHYFGDEHGVIHVEANSPATAKSPRLN
jgi:hypothetical protein